VDPARLQGADEPLAVRLVRPDAVVLVLGAVGDVGDVARHLAAVHVDDVGELDRGILLDDLLHDRFLNVRLHGLHDRVLHDLAHHGDGGLRRPVLDLFQSGQEQLGDVLAYAFFHLFVRDARLPSGRVFLRDPLGDLGDAGMPLVDGVIAGKAQLQVDPMGDPRLPRLVGDHRNDGPLQELRRIEDVVDLFGLDEAVGVNPRPRNIELCPDKGIVLGDPHTDLPLEIVGDIRDHRRIDPVGAAAELDIFDDQALERGIPGPFAEPQQRRIGGGAAEQPRAGGVVEGAVEVIVPVPLEEATGNAGILDEGPHELVHAPGQRGARVRHAVPHRIAEADLDVDAALIPQFHEFLGKGNAEPVDVRPRQVLEMAARPDAGIQDRRHDVQVFLHRLPPRLLQLQEDVVVGYRRENAGFLKPRFPDKLGVVLVGPDPAGDLRKRQAELPAPVHRFAILAAVQKEFALADYAIRAAQAAHQREEIGDLLDAVGGTRLLPVAERRVRDEDLRGGIDGKQAVIEVDPADFIVGEDVFLEVGFAYLLEIGLPEIRVFVVQDFLLLVPFRHSLSPKGDLEARSGKRLEGR